MLYYVIDEKQRGDVYIHGSKETICKEMNLTSKQFESYLNNNRHIDGQYLIIEDEDSVDEEDWECYEKIGRTYYYVSSLGNTRSYNLDTKTFKDNLAYEKNGRIVVNYKDNTIPLKILVAKTFVRGYADECTVKFKSNEANHLYSAENIRIVPHVKKSKSVEETEIIRKVGRYFNNELRKEYNSIRECAADLKMDPKLVKSHISEIEDYGNGLRYIETI